MRSILPSLLAYIAAAVVTLGAPTPSKKPRAKPSIAEQLATDRQRLEQPVQLPSPYAEAQRRVTEGPQPAWWHTDAGLADTVPPPWTAVKVDGHRVDVSGRAYRLAESGLPEAIESDATPLLSGPVRFLATVDGRPTELQGAKLQLDSAKDNAALFTAHSRLGTLSLEISVSIEYDGFARFDATVSGAQPTNLDQLILEIPLRAECASYYSHDALGVLPLTKANGDLLFESGVNGGLLPSAGLTLTFTPQVILSNDRVGLSFVTPTERGWSDADRQKMIEIVRRGDRVVLRVHFVDQRTRLEKPLRLSWALTALPSRPRPTWATYETFNSAQWASAGAFLASALKPGPGGANDTPLDRAAHDGLKVVIMHQQWTEMQGYPGTLREANARQLRQAVEEAHKRHLKVVAYIGQEISRAFPEWQRYGAAMVRMPLLGGSRRTDPPAESFRPCANSVYADFLAYKIREMIRQFDIDGIFLDGHPDITACLNTEHGHGYQTDTGEWRATFDVYDDRRMIQRLYVLFHGGEKSDGVLVLHGGGGWTPAFSFGDYRLAGETEVYHHQRHPELSLNDILSPEYFRAVYDPAVNGLPLAWMSKPDKGGLSFAQDRAVTLLDGVMQRASWPEFSSRGGDVAQGSTDVGGLNTAWKIWRIFGQFHPDTAQWYSYTDAQSPVTVQPAAVRLSCFARTGDGVLAVVSNVGQSQQTAAVNFDLQALRLGAEEVTVRDALSNEVLALEGNRLTLDVKPESCRLLLLQKRR